MKENKRIEKELLFKTNIKDITTISLDSDYNVDKKHIVGNFLITGEYKIHEVSINREKFNFKIPFKHEIEDDIDTKTINLEITNFEYDYNKDELMVNIEYDITADRKDVLIFDDEESLDEFLSSREVEIVDTRIDDIKKELESKEEIEEIIEVKKEQEDKEIKIETNKDRKDISELKEITDKKNEKELNEDRNDIKEDKEIINKVDEVNIENSIEVNNEDRDNIKTDEIINKVNNIDDSFVTYKVYTIKENETLESIVVKYQTTIDELKDYNDLNNLSINDKIIIPHYE